jgi:hypothetical protein
MKDPIVQAALIIAIAILVCTFIFMFPTYRCMSIMGDGFGSDVACLINAK